MGWVRSVFILMASPGPNQSLHRQIESQPDRKVTGGGGHRYPTFPSITVPLWKPVMIEIPNETRGDLAEDEERNLSWEIRTASGTAGGGGGEKKSTSWTKGKKKRVEQNKRRVQEIWHLIVLCSPCFLRWYRKQWVDVATPWGLHIYDAHHRSDRVLTPTWCAWQRLGVTTRAAQRGQKRGRGKEWVNYPIKSV